MLCRREDVPLAVRKPRLVALTPDPYYRGANRGASATRVEGLPTDLSMTEVSA